MLRCSADLDGIDASKEAKAGAEDQREGGDNEVEDTWGGRLLPLHHLRGKLVTENFFLPAGSRVCILRGQRPVIQAPLRSRPLGCMADDNGAVTCTLHESIYYCSLREDFMHLSHLGVPAVLSSEFYEATLGCLHVPHFCRGRGGVILFLQLQSHFDSLV